MPQIPVGILGATGMVGQQSIALLANHPWFKVEWLGQPAPSKAFKDAAAWRLPNPRPTTSRTRWSSRRTNHLSWSSRARFAVHGNRGAFTSRPRGRQQRTTTAWKRPCRCDSRVNADHLALLAAQSEERGWKGKIVTNPNCATVVIAMALAPLRQFGITTTMITTLQAISGAGYPGVASWDILGNVIPQIGGGEEDKVESESNKILGTLSQSNTRVELHPVRISATTTRVPVQNGHTASMSVGLSQKPSPEDLIQAWKSFKEPTGSGAAVGATGSARVPH